MTVYPMARGTLVNFAAFRARYERENTRLDAGVPMVSSVSKEEFREDFGEWEEEAKVLIDVRPFASTLFIGCLFSKVDLVVGCSVWIQRAAGRCIRLSR